MHRLFPLWVFLFFIFNSWVAVAQESRVAELESYNSLLKTLASYLESSVSGDIETLKKIHHEKASLYGLIHGELTTGTPQVYFDQLEKVGSPRANGEEVDYSITYTQVDGDIANAEIQFVNFWCGTGTHYLQFIRIEGSWKIVSDLFWFRAMPDSDAVSESCNK